MRHTILAVAAAAIAGLSLPACGSGSSSADMGADLGAAAKLNCLAVGYCEYQCVSSGKGSFTTCFQMCSTNAKPNSAKMWSDAFTCGQDYCLGPADMGGKCVILHDPTNNPANPDLLCDAGQTYQQCAAATTAGPCIMCIADARNLIYADFSTNPAGPPTGMCINASSPDCKGGAMCTSLMNACIGDM